MPSLALLAAGLACASSGQTPATGSPARVATAPAAALLGTDSTRQQPAGSLRQDAIALRFQLRGVQARMFPLEESVISLLSPDSWRSMRDVLLSQQDRIDRARIASGNDRFSIWYVSFHATEPDARFSPSSVVIRAAGRDHQPVEIIPLSAGFAQQRLQLRQSQTALYLFEPTVDIGQPIEVSMEDVRNNDWSSILLVLERERVRQREMRRDTLGLRLSSSGLFNNGGFSPTTLINARE